MSGEREVAGLRCGEVLAGLTEYLEGALPKAVREQVEAHVRGCERCERFGGAFQATVRAIRSPRDADSELLRRLEARVLGR